jgi:C_GCAxxG_C_C family probable redox protein
MEASMKPEEMKEKARDLFLKRFHCSQAVLAVGQEKLGIVDESVIKAMGLFGGGVSGYGRTCGALLGAMAVISCMYSRGNLKEKENPVMWKLGAKINKKFEDLTEPYGGVDCRSIARVNWKDPVAAKEFYSNPESRRKICIELVGDITAALGELIEEETAKQKV